MLSLQFDSQLQWIHDTCSDQGAVLRGQVSSFSVTKHYKVRLGTTLSLRYTILYLLCLTLESYQIKK